MVFIIKGKELALKSKKLRGKQKEAYYLMIQIQKLPEAPQIWTVC